MSATCRTCLQTVDSTFFFYIDTFDNEGIANTIPKDVLQLCIPEMDLYVSNQPGICGSCLGVFESFYNFKNQCLGTEERIQAFLKRNRIDPCTKVDLSLVLQDNGEEYPLLNGVLNGFRPDCENGEVIDFAHRNEFAPENLLRPIENCRIEMLMETENDDVVVFNLNKKISNTNGDMSCEEKSSVAGGDNDNILLISCNKCSYVTMDKSKLAEHRCMRIMTGNSEKYKCPYCMYSSCRRQRLSNHINSKHIGNIQVAAMTQKCDQCDFKTLVRDVMMRHKKVAHGSVGGNNPLVLNMVPSPPKVLPQPALTEMKTFTCMLCPFTCCSEITLQRHRTATHGPPIQYCEFCSYQTKDKSNFRKHLFVHSEKPLKCTMCTYNCVSPYQLTKHYKKCH